jgi:hydroxypyruvate isomerase
MPKFSANLNYLFNEHPFLERFAACREAGFRYVEYMFPYDHDSQVLRDLMEAYELQQVLFNMPAGDWSAGDRGIASDPNRIEVFRDSVEKALEYARPLGVERVNCLAGKRIQGVPQQEQWDVLVENLRYAAAEFAKDDRILLVEPINTYDIPGFFVSKSEDGFGVLEAVGAVNLLLQYDVYHMQKMEGNLTETIRDNITRVGHIQIADNPGRHQPGTGEINYRFLLGELDRMGYDGYVGLEYNPNLDTLSSLDWVRKLGFELGS